MDSYANGQSDHLEGRMDNLSISQERAARKKKTRHILDSSVNSAPTNGFSQSQFLSQGNFSHAETSKAQQQDTQGQNGSSSAQGRSNYQYGSASSPQSQEQGHSGHTQQPGRAVMESGQFPSMADDLREATEHYRRNLFYTGQRGVLNPPANVDFSAVDQGSSNPKFARLSMGSIPTTDDLLTASSLPLSLSIQPLADLNSQEDVVPLVDCTHNDVPRCHRCRTYMNPSMQFIHGGSKYSCNICGFANETPADYYAPSDVNGRRQDWNQRPELQYGTCDFLVGQDFWSKNKKPEPLHILFAIDVSEQSLVRDIPKAIIAAISQALYGEQAERLPEGARIAIMAFDRACHFFNLNPTLEKNVQMLSVPDVDDMFVPIQEGLFADPWKSRAIIEATLAAIGTIFDKDRVPEPALGAVTRAAYLALQPTGGKLSLFVGALPTWGPGRLRVRENTSLYNTPEQKTLYDAAEVHWKNIAEEFVNIGVGVDCFFFPNSYIDLATIGTLSQTTGGDIFFYQNYIHERDEPKFCKELQRSLSRAQGAAVQMKLRCSNGLKVVTILGQFLQKGPSDLEMGTVDADKAITFVLKHDGKLPAQTEVHFQSGILFTTPQGQRVLRTHNVKCGSTSAIGEVLRHSDSGAVVVTLAKIACDQVLKMELQAVKQIITDQCVRILTAYRKHSASNVPAGELILPESLKVLPLLMLAMQKQFSFRTDSINSDVRVNNQRLIRRSTVRDVLSLIYPRLIPIHSLLPDDGFADETGHLQMPPIARNSFMQLENGGAYIYDNGQSLLLWFKSDVSPALLQDLYGPEFSSLESLQPRSARLPELETLLNIQVRNIIAYLNTFSTSRHLVPQIARQGLDGSEMIFAQALVDDRNCDNKSYSDFLISVHKYVQLSLAESQQSKSLGSWITGTEQAY